VQPRLRLSSIAGRAGFQPVRVAGGKPGIRRVDAEVAEAVADGVHHGEDRGADLVPALDQGP
jgi:hypothetical protein